MAALLLVGLVSGCAGQQGGDEAGDPGAPRVLGAPGAAEWRSDGCSTPRSPVMTRTAGVTFPLSNSQVQELVTKITEAGEARFASVYAGLEMTPDQLALIVYRKPSTEFDAYLRAQAGDQCLTVRDAAHSQAELMSLVDRISGDFAYWRSRGIAINSVGPKHDGSGIEVGTQAVAAAQIELPTRYGTAVPIKVVDQGPVAPLIGSAK